MSYISVNFWQGSKVDDGFVTAAVDTIDNEFDPQVYFDIYGYDMTSWGYPKFSTSETYWGDILPEFYDFVESEYGTPLDNECHVLLLDRIESNGTIGHPGAGQTHGSLGYKEGVWSGSLAACSGVNVAVKAFENLTGVYQGSGDRAFRNDVMHEVSHSLFDPDLVNTPADDCATMGGKYLQHSCGAIYGGILRSVSPLQTWYTSNTLDNNSPPCNNCDGHPNETVNDGTNKDFTDCTVSGLESYYDYISSNI